MKKSLNPKLTFTTIIYLRWFIDLHRKAKNIKASRVNHERITSYSTVCKNVLDTKSADQKIIREGLSFIKVKNFHSSKVAVNKSDQRLGKNIFKIRILQQIYSVFRMYDELLWINNIRKTTGLTNGHETWINVSEK